MSPEDDSTVSDDTDSADSPRRHRMPTGKARRASVAAAEPDDGDPETSEETDTATTEADDAEATDASADAAESSDESSEGSEVEPQRVVFVERKPPGRFAPIAIGVAAALFIGAGAFAGAMLQPYLSERAAAHTKVDVARTAGSAVTTLWTYTPDDMDQLTTRAEQFLTGDFLVQYRKNIDAIVPTNKQAQVSNNTEVVGAAVESLDGPNATALVYTNSTSTSPLTKNIPSLRYSSYRLTMLREGAQWRVTGMSSVTNLDLTPQI